MTSASLHLTKCAGTSLISSVRRRLTDDKYILVSSYYENILASRAQPWDIADFSRIRIVFGHYIHESLSQLIKPKSIWDLFLFTGVREPSSPEDYTATIGPVDQSIGLSTPDLKTAQVVDNARSIDLNPNIASQITRRVENSDDVRLYIDKAGN